MSAILTVRETEVCCLIADGMCDKDIAKQLGLNYFSLKRINQRIYNKFQINNGYKRIKLVGLITGETSMQPLEVRAGDGER